MLKELNFRLKLDPRRLALCLFIFSSLSAWTASMPEPIREASKLLRPKEEEVLKLERAQVVLADYALLKKDFPQLKGLSDPEIDQWLLNNVAFISRPQSQQNLVNTHIATNSETRKAFRPQDYGRALVYEVKNPKNTDETIGLIDVKGSGSLSPSKGHHSNGLSTLGEGVREFIYENMVREVLEDSGSGANTVGSYAVIDPGFDVVHDDGSRSRAGLYLRQGHTRNSDEWIRGSRGKRLEKFFNRYGIYVEGNIQGNKQGDILDFGHYVVKKELPSDGYPDKRIPFDVWGIDESVPQNSQRWFHAKYERPWYYSHELADSWARGDADRHAFFIHYKNMLSPVKQRLARDKQNCASALLNVIGN